MVDRALPIRPRQRFTLSVRNGNDRYICEVPINRHQIGEVESTMKGCNVRGMLVVTEREVKVVNVVVNDVKILFFAEDLVQHDDVMSQLVDAIRIQSQSSFTGRDQTRCSQGVSARKQGYLMTETDQFLRQP